MEKQRADILDNLIIEDIKRKEREKKQEQPIAPPPVEFPMGDEKPTSNKKDEGIIDLNDSNVGYSWSKAENE